MTTEEAILGGLAAHKSAGTAESAEHTYACIAHLAPLLPEDDDLRALAERTLADREYLGRRARDLAVEIALRVWHSSKP